MVALWASNEYLRTAEDGANEICVMAEACLGDRVRNETVVYQSEL